MTQSIFKAQLLKKPKDVVVNDDYFISDQAGHFFCLHLIPRREKNYEINL